MWGLTWSCSAMKKPVTWISLHSTVLELICGLWVLLLWRAVRAPSSVHPGLSSAARVRERTIGYAPSPLSSLPVWWRSAQATVSWCIGAGWLCFPPSISAGYPVMLHQQQFEKRRWLHMCHRRHVLAFILRVFLTVSWQIEQDWTWSWSPVCGLSTGEVANVVFPLQTTRGRPREPSFTL